MSNSLTMDRANGTKFVTVTLEQLFNRRPHEEKEKEAREETIFNAYEANA